MNDFVKEQETLEKYISETGPIIKSLQELQVFFATKELSEAEQAEVWAVPGVIQTYADQAALAKTLLDAIAYYRRESAKVRQQRNNVWLEIAQLKAEENELKKQLHAITEGVKVRDEVVETVARRGCRMIPSDLLAEEETTMPEKRDPACKKRRRSFARKVVDKSKEVINHIRSRSNSRARVNFD